MFGKWSKTSANKCWLSGLVVPKANRENPDQKKQSDLGLLCLSMPFWQATSVRNFITHLP